MTAGIFHQHGVWVGSHRPGDAVNAKGHYENIPLRTFLHGKFPNVVPTATPAVPDHDLRDEILSLIRNDGYKGGPWLFKCTAMYHPAFAGFDYVGIGTIRPVEQVFASCRKTGMLGKLTDEQLYANIRAHQTEIRRVSHAVVFTDEVANGNFDSIRDAIETAGLEWNENACEAFVDRKLWHYGT